MPLPNDERVVALANDLLQVFDQLFGVHPGYRAAHAKGMMLTGSFTPAAGAQRLTRAPHIAREITPVTVRFSNSTGLPLIPDSAPDANPRGMAIRFNLAEHVHTDIVAHSIDAFPTRDGYEFLEFLQSRSRQRTRHSVAQARRKVSWRSSGRAGLCPGSQAVSHRAWRRRLTLP